MKDPAIRNLLKRTELSQYINDFHSKVVEEMNLPVAKARIDIAVINGHMHGFEIKGSNDTLKRLPSQLTAYQKVFDYVTIITELKYHERILNFIPDWIGVSVCSDKKDENEFEVIKPPCFNENKDGFYVAKLLWRDEISALLMGQQIQFKKNDRCWTLCEIAQATIPIDLLSQLVRDTLKKRVDWKTDSLQNTMQ